MKCFFNYKLIIQKKIIKTVKSDHFWFFIISFSFYFFLLNQTKYLFDSDLYFHLKIADMLRQKFFVNNLPSMAYSIHAEKYVDYHFLFHWLLVPFTLFTKNLILSGKMGISFFSAFSVCMLTFLLKELKVKYRWFWIIFYLLASPIFTGRLLFGRGITLFIGIIFIYIIFALKKQKIGLFIISWISVWTYPGFLVLIIFILVYTLSNLLNKFESSKDDLQVFFYSILGFVVGFLIHPSFPNQFYGYWVELIVQFFKPEDLEVISEWTPPNSLLVKTAVMIPLFLFFFRIFKTDKHTPLESTLLIFVFIFIITLTNSIKPFEYLIPFLVIYLALKDWDNYPKIIKNSILISSLLLMFLWSLPEIYKRIQYHIKTINPEKSFETAEWLKSNTSEESIITLEWGFYPVFYFKNDHNRYLFGLNPAYSYSYNKNKYLLIRNFFKGKISNAEEIDKELNSNFIVLNKRTNILAINQIYKKENIIYENEEYLVYKIIL